MAIQDFDASQVPRDAVAELSLTAGASYQIYNASTTATVFYRPGDTLATTATRGFKVEPGSFAFFSHETGEVVSVWTDDAGGCPCLISETV